MTKRLAIQQAQTKQKQPQAVPVDPEVPAAEIPAATAEATKRSPTDPAEERTYTFESLQRLNLLISILQRSLDKCRTELIQGKTTLVYRIRAGSIEETFNEIHDIH